MTALPDLPSLLVALRAAKGGETLTMAPGPWGDVALRGFQFADPVTIAPSPISGLAGGGAVFRSLSIVQCAGLTLQAPTVRYTPAVSTYAWSQIVSVINSSDIAFKGGKIQGGPAVNGIQPSSPGPLDATGNVIGFPTPDGIGVTNSPNCTFDGVEISQTNSGFVLAGSPHLLVKGCNIHDARHPPIHGQASDFMTFVGNRVGSCHPWGWPPVNGQNFDHGDFFHFWTAAGTTAPCVGLSITDNVCDQGTGAAVLGIYLCEHGASNGTGGFLAPQVLRNRVSTDDLQAVRFDHVIDGVVQENILGPHTPGAKPAGYVILAYGSRDNTVTLNTLSQVAFSAGMTPDDIASNIVAPNSAPPIGVRA